MRLAEQGSQSFQGMRLRQARLAADLTGAELAERVGISRQALSAFEGGKSPGAETVELLARALGVEPSFFFLPLTTGADKAASAIYFRALRRSPEFQKERSSSALSWAAELCFRFSRWLDLPPAHLPQSLDVSPRDLTPQVVEDVAREARRHFGLGDGPIDRLFLLLENHGVLVGYAAMGDDMDGISAWFEDRPIMLIRQGTTWARGRFDAAHELAHLILHRHVRQQDLEDPNCHKLMEDQAHRFAGAFLLPEEGFATEVYRTDLDSLVLLKRRWGVSVQAIIIRLKQLGFLSPQQVARLYQGIGRRRWRKEEPLDREIPAEEPVLLRRAAAFLSENRILPFHEAFTRSKLPKSFLEAVAGLKPDELTPLTPDRAAVIEFRRR